MDPARQSTSADFQPAGSLERLPSVSVIIPTYCEAENLEVLIPKLSHILGRAGLTAEIIVVDDNSPDDTEALCNRLSQENPVTLLTRRNERGLSSAVLHGMRFARGNVFVVMDADLSHPPEKVPELVDAIQCSNVDFVIGSRYVADGEIQEGWGVFRWVNSRLATLLAWPLTRAKDPMAGFFAVRRNTFVSAKSLDPVGYKIGLELIVKCDCNRIAEIPIQFRDRLHGESKLTVREQFEYLRHLKRLYEFKFGRASRFLQFAGVGASGAVLDLIILSLLLRWLPFSAARALAIWVAMTWNFWLNRRVTFSYARIETVLPQYTKFCLSCSVGAAVNWTVSTVLWSTSAQVLRSPLLAGAAGILSGLILNYVLSQHVVFGSPKSSERG